MKNPWFIPVVTLAVGAASGYLVGSGNEPTPGKALDSKSPTTRTERRSGRSGGSDAAATRGRSRNMDEIYRAPSQVSRVQSLIDYYGKLNAEQFAAEADKLESLPSTDRIIAAYLLFAKWAEIAPNDAMAHTDKMGFTGMFVKPTVLQSWASTDPENAAAYYAKNPREFAMMGAMEMGGGRGGRGGGSASSIIAAEWAKQDPEGAMAWAKTLKGGDSRAAMGGVIEQLAKQDPSAAAAMVASMDQGPRGDANATIAREWASKDWGKTEAWINGLPADQRDAAFSSALRGLAASDPTLASSKYASLPDGRSRDEAANVIAQGLGKTNPQAGITWVMANGSADAQQEAIRPLMMSYSRTNDAGAQALLTSMPPGEVRDRAASTYVFSNMSSNPKAVMSVAESITDERTRERTLQMSAARWVAEDRTAAEQYIQSSQAFDAETKQRLLSADGGGGGNGNSWRDRMRGGSR